MLEEFRGGMNAFVHVSMPDEVLIDVEQHKMHCTDCGRQYCLE